MEGLTSAFLLDFGPVLVVEFSAVGNACYLYRKRNAETILPDFWTSRHLGAGALKDRALCEDWIVHRKKRITYARGWEEEAAQALAQFGIRPGGRR
jgi:hypothetical protein